MELFRALNAVLNEENVFCAAVDMGHASYNLCYRWTSLLVFLFVARPSRKCLTQQTADVVLPVMQRGGFGSPHGSGVVYYYDPVFL